ncbi:PucR family transcriptional regulator, partial [Streptomyces aurantiacus]|uniref:PucR family transcriptional regulator n=1 Tax=Streptomyces aurantiacus TaxID=47760 RepID=UPI00068C84FC
ASAAPDLSGAALRRLTRAAAHSGAALIAEAAELTDGWAVLVDPVTGAVHSTPHAAGPEGERAAAHPGAHPHLTIHQVNDAAGSVLVLGPRRTPAAQAGLVARATADLLRVRSRRADEVRDAEQRLHSAVLRLLLHGHHHLAADVLGGGAATHATVHRLPGRAAHTAYQALWRAAQPGVSLGGTRVLLCLDGAELVVVALHGAHDDQHSVLSLVARVADRHQLAGGAADPAPLDMFATAWAEAGTARNGAAVGCLTSATGLGAHGLPRVVPADRLAAWAAAVLQPLDREQRRTLEAWLRSGSALAAAHALDVAEGTVRTRLRAIRTLLDADLDDPTAQAQLLLALRAPAAAVTTGPPPSAARPARVSPHQPLPTALLTPEQAHRWASALLGPLDTRLRITLRCWLAHRGRTAPAAAALGLHRTTLTTWLAECGRLLALDLSSATTRTELRLAVETVATPDDVPTALPRRGGRTYRGPRP